jgi:hypothetical protein
MSTTTSTQQDAALAKNSDVADLVRSFVASMPVRGIKAHTDHQTGEVMVTGAKPADLEFLRKHSKLAIAAIKAAGLLLDAAPPKPAASPTATKPTPAKRPAQSARPPVQDDALARAVKLMSAVELIAHVCGLGASFRLSPCASQFFVTGVKRLRPCEVEALRARRDAVLFQLRGFAECDLYEDRDDPILRPTFH